MERRTFITKTGATAAFVGLGGLSLQSCFGVTQKHITILHTNDVHSHIDAFGADHASFPNQGGVARRASLVSQVRKENPNTLLLDAGDMFQGTPYFNFYGGELEFKLMSMLRYDVATIGNHDFDNGIDGLYAQLPHAKFDLVSANYDFTNTIMDTHVKPYKVVVKDGIKIGIFGLGIELQGLVSSSLYKETTYHNPIEVAQEISNSLRDTEQCDLVICLSHLGYEYKNSTKPDDLKLAAQTDGIDLIIGGHTHTFLNEPTVATNRKGENVLVNQVGCFGVNVGRVDFYFNQNLEANASGTSISV